MSLYPQAAKSTASMAEYMHSVQFSKHTLSYQSCASWVGPAIKSPGGLSAPFLGGFAAPPPHPVLYWRAGGALCGLLPAAGRSGSRIPHVHKGAEVVFGSGECAKGWSMCCFSIQIFLQAYWGLAQEADIELRLPRPLFQEVLFYL